MKENKRKIFASLSESLSLCLLDSSVSYAGGLPVLSVNDLAKPLCHFHIPFLLITSQSLSETLQRLLSLSSFL